MLVISYVGHQTIEMAVSKNTAAALKIVLKQAVSKVEEVVVVGYGTQKRKDLTGSVSSIGACTD